MAEGILIDASAWYALLQPRDKNYARAWTLWRGLLDRKWPLFTTNWTLYEAATVLACRDGRHDLACRLLDLATDAATIVRAADVEEQALQTFRTHADKRWSVVDCANFEAMRRQGCQRAVAFDEHFRQAQSEFGFQVLS